MLAKTNIILVVMLSIVFLTSIVSMVSTSQDSNATIRELLNDLQRIDDLGRVLDLNALEKLAVELEKKWFVKDKEGYGFIIQKLCGTFSSYDFENDRQYELARQYAVLALEKSHTLQENNKIPIEAELQLLMYVHSVKVCPEYFIALAKNEDWPNQRGRTAKLYFRSWDRLAKSIDKKWDPNDPSIVYPRPPDGVKQWVIGMSPDQISDPNLRAEYEAALKVFWQKKKRHIEQRHLRQLQKEYLPILQKHLIILYSGPDFDSKKLQTEALQNDLEKHIKNNEVRTTILDGLRKRLIEESETKPKEKPGGRRRLETRQPSK